MNIKKSVFIPAIIFFALFHSKNSAANEVNFSVGFGWPYLIVPTLNLKTENLNYFANYKIGLDDGFSFGVEKQLNNHSYGAFIGALGAKKSPQKCDITKPCRYVITITDRNTTQGIGISYEYKMFQISENLALRSELGYGYDSKSKKNRFDGNIQMVYHF